jgi:hypothetical protein
MLIPALASVPGMEMFPAVVAIIVVLPDFDGPRFLLKSTLIVKTFPATCISIFFIPYHFLFVLLNLSYYRVIQLASNIYSLKRAGNSREIK